MDFIINLELMISFFLDELVYWYLNTRLLFTTSQFLVLFSFTNFWLLNHLFFLEFLQYDEFVIYLTVLILIPTLFFSLIVWLFIWWFRKFKKWSKNNAISRPPKYCKVFWDLWRQETCLFSHGVADWRGTNLNYN